MKIRITASVLALAFGASAQADLWEFTSMLSGLNEVPPNGSPATGTSVGTYDDVSNMFMMDTNATDFVAPVTAAHIHLAPPGVSGPVIFPLSGATGNTSYTSHDMFVFTELQEADFLAGNYYVNIHSQEFPGGEVRGQLNPTPVPEPASIAILGMGLAMLSLARRRK